MLSCPITLPAVFGLSAPSHSRALVLGMSSSVLAVSPRPWRAKDVQAAKLHGLREGRANTPQLRSDPVNVVH